MEMFFLMFGTPTITFGLAFGLAYCVSLVANWTDKIALSSIIGFVAAAIAFSRLVHRYTEYKMPVEKIISNRDNVMLSETKTKPQTDQHTKVVTIHKDNGENYPSGAYSSLPVEFGSLRSFCVGVHKHQRPITESEWTGASGLFSKSQFVQLRSALINRGVLRWKNPDYKQQGIEITKPGRSFFKDVSEFMVLEPTAPPDIFEPNNDMRELSL